MECSSPLHKSFKNWLDIEQKALLAYVLQVFQNNFYLL